MSVVALSAWQQVKHRQATMIDWKDRLFMTKGLMSYSNNERILKQAAALSKNPTDAKEVEQLFCQLVALIIECADDR